MNDEEDLFELLLETPVENRSALLDQHCADQPELRRRLERLLAAHIQSNLLDAPIAASEMHRVVQDFKSSDQAKDQTVDYRKDHEGRCYGPYTLERLLGEGGMGAVWVAKQSHPVKRRVALKLIKAGMDSRDVLARFDHERQALAVMDHPSIARVLDGGLTEDGRPYFAMELVNGLPLTKFCDEAKLSTEERLDIFVQICSAVQHAHQKGIIHRDLKPANILVTLIDGKAIPKVIDFGVSKALSGSLSDQTLTTQFGAVIGTFEYMAPEQAGYSGTDIDTRADIYALGVILYEMLTGLKPFDSMRIRKAAVDEVLRIIREEEPSKPSTRLSSSESKPSLAALRRLDPSSLARKIRGDLDWIALKCLEKDRNRRYETANQLALEIRRYLADEPVLAGRPSASYLLRKFVRRNRRQVFTVAAIFGALVAGLCISLWQMNRAMVAERAATKAQNDEAMQKTRAEENEKRALDGSRQARKALDAVTDDVVQSLFNKSAGLSHKEREFLTRILGFYDELVKLDNDDPEMIEYRARGYGRIGDMQLRLNASDDAFAAYNSLRQIRQTQMEKEPHSQEPRLAYIQALRRACISLEQAGMKDKANEMTKEAESMLAESIQRFPESHWIYLEVLGFRWDSARRATRSQSPALVRAVIDDCQRFDAAHPEDSIALTVEIDAICALFDLHEIPLTSDEAAMLDKRALELIERGKSLPKWSSTEHSLSQRGHVAVQHGIRLAARGDRESALTSFRIATEVTRQRLQNNTSNLWVWNDLFKEWQLAWNTLEENQQWREAAEEIHAFERYLLQMNDRLPDLRQSVWFQAEAQNDLVRVLQRGGGSREEAVSALLTAAEYRAANLDKCDDPKAYRKSIAEYRESAANLLGELGRLDEAIDQRRQAIAFRRSLISDFPEAPFSSIVRNSLGWSYLDLALGLFGKKETALGIAEIEHGIAVFNEEIANKANEAESVKFKVWARDGIAHAYHRLADHWRNIGEPAKARDTYNIAIEWETKSYEAHPDDYMTLNLLATAWHLRGHCNLSLGQLTAGVNDLRAAIDLLKKAPSNEQRATSLIVQWINQLDEIAEKRRGAGQAGEALPIFRNALTIRESLVAASPDSSMFRQHEIWTRYNICNALSDLGRSEELTQELEGLKLPVKQICDDKNCDRDILLNVAETIGKIAAKLRNVGQPKASMDAYRLNFSIYQRLVERFPENPELLHGIGWSHADFAASHLLLREDELAVTAFRKAIDVMAAWVERTPNDANALRQYERVVANACEVLEKVNLHRAIADVVDDYLKRDPTSQGEAAPKNATILSRGGIAHLALKEFPEAERDFRICLAIRERTAPNEWQTWNTRSFLGGALLSQGKLDEAAKYLTTGYEGMLARRAAIPETFKHRLPDAVKRLIQLSEAQGNLSDIQKWKAELARLEGEAASPPKPDAQP